jgi:predicted XRE-type DNA-binding protein
MSAETIEMGSGNVFADLGYAEADTHLFKAHLVSRITDVIAARKLAQVAATKVMSVSQPDVSRMLKGHFRDVSVERIMGMLTRLGYDIEIKVRPATEPVRRLTLAAS